MTREQFEQSLAEYLEGTLGEAETDALLHAAEQDPALARELQAYLQLDTRLEQYFGVERERLETMENPVAGHQPAATPVRPRWHAPVWAAAALALIVLGVATWQTWRMSVPAGATEVARLAMADGPVLMLTADGYRTLDAGAAIPEGRKLKVAGRYAAFSLAGKDNRLEADAGGQFTLHDFPDRTEVEMHLGRVWTHLPTPPAQRFVIRTPHLTATATGTVFGVEETLDRSVVRVAEGSVQIEAETQQTTLAAGETFVSLEGASVPPAAEAIGWSHQREELLALLPPPATDAGDPDKLVLSQPAPAAPVPATAATPAPSIDDLLAVLPEDTRFFVELPDLPKVRNDLLGTDYTAVLKEAALRAWWNSIEGGEAFEKIKKEMRLEELLTVLWRLDGQVAVAIDSKGRFLAVADYHRDGQALMNWLREETPGATADPPTPEQLQRWENLQRHVRWVNGRVVLGKDPAQVNDTARRLATGEATGFLTGDFYRKIERNIGDAPVVAALDVASVLTPALLKLNEIQRGPYDLLGLGSLDYVLLAPQAEGRGIAQAARIGFQQRRAGMMNWLAEPRPMRGLDFFSDEVHFFGAAVLRNPREALYDLMLTIPLEQMEPVMRAIVEYCDANKPFLDTFGGEVALALESPILPVPNLKLAIELRDPQAFADYFDPLVQSFIDRINATGAVAYLEETAHKGRTVTSFVVDGAPVELAWAFVDDYLVLGPGPRFVANSIDVFDSGHGIGDDSRLLDLLPQTTGSEFSLLVYQDIARMIPTVLSSTLLSRLQPAERAQMPDFSFLERYRAPGIAFAYAADDHIDLYLNTPGGIDFNLGMSVPLVTNWVRARINVGATADRYVEANLRLERLAVATEVYREHEGHWPATLGDLLAGGLYLDRIPEDPFGVRQGDALRMLPGPDGVTFYSIGPDGADNAAELIYDPAGQIDGDGDIVLKLPRPPAE